MRRADAVRGAKSRRKHKTRTALQYGKPRQPWHMRAGAHLAHGSTLCGRDGFLNLLRRPMNRVGRALAQLRELEWVKVIEPLTRIVSRACHSLIERQHI